MNYEKEEKEAYLNQTGQSPNVNDRKLFLSTSITQRQNKLECLSPKKFQARIVLAGEAIA
jgi:hypothetical protein